jgi:hypothetical protein
MAQRPDPTSADTPDTRPLWPPFRLRCREAATLMLAAQDRPAALGERVRVRLHLCVCSACTRFSQQLGLMQQALGRWRSDVERDDDPPAPPPGPPTGPRPGPLIGPKNTR